MPTESQHRVEVLFGQACERPPAERTAFLRRHCTDPAVRGEVESLLAAEDDARRFFDDLAADAVDPMVDAVREETAFSSPELTGRRVGPYHLVEEIGVGGMSVVYRAERADADFDQTVAVKLLQRRLHADGAEQRFRAERQVLANLDHPHIAKLHDGGVTEGGRPYLVMEHVDGTPLTEYADANDLSLQARLDLLEQVLEAVQAAHRQLVVHRDLKPSNVLVAETESGPQITLLDFGIAKLLDDSMAVTAPQTETGHHLMTPAYAAPEQVTGDDVTTRTDVYQLGVLAYELLAGTRPFDLSGKGLAEIERIVLTEEPPAPSEQAEANAGRLRGDLDTILQKALRKEPERRYRSVEALAADLARHRAGEPIAARPATIGYRAKKFVQRNRWGVGVAAAFLALIAVAGTLLVRQRNRAQRNAERARQEAETAEQVSDFLVNLFQSSNPLETLGDTVTARELLRLGTDQVATLDEQPEVKAQMLVSMGRAYEGLGRYQNADSLLSAALSIRQQVSDDQPAKIAEGLHYLGSVAYEQRELQRADSLLKRALTLRRRAYDAPHPALAHTLNDLGIVRRNREQHASADTLYQQALAMRRSLHGPESPEVLSTLDNIAVLRGKQRQYEEAEALYRKVLRLSREAFGNEHPRVANTLHNLAGTLRRQGQLEEAERTYRKALATYRALVGDTHPKVAQSMDDLAGVLRQRGQFAEAASLLRQALVIRRKRFGEDHIKVGTSLNNLAAVLNRQDRYDEAVQMQRRAVSLYERQLGPEHEYVAIALDNLADYLRDRDGCGAAVDEYRRARRILQTEGMDGGLMFADVEGAYGRCLAKIGRYEKAIPLLKRSYQAYEDDDSPRAAEFRRALASAYANWGKPKQARQYRRAADGDASGE